MNPRSKQILDRLLVDGHSVEKLVSIYWDHLCRFDNMQRDPQAYKFLKDVRDRGDLDHDEVFQIVEDLSSDECEGIINQKNQANCDECRKLLGYLTGSDEYYCQSCDTLYKQGKFEVMLYNDLLGETIGLVKIQGQKNLKNE